MKAIGAPFCEVCAEALVLAIYQHARPVDSFFPGSTNLSISTTQSFSVTLLQPATHNLNVQWFTNAAVMPAATNTQFTISPQTLGNGTQTVSVVVADGTSLVRTDPSNSLQQTITWHLTVTIPQLQLDSAFLSSPGQFSFRVSGSAPQGFALQVSTNLVTWDQLLTNSLTGGQFWYTNSNVTAFPRRFFRAVTM